MSITALAPFRLACPSDHDVAQRERVGLRDLKRLQLLLMEDGHCLREHTLALCDGRLLPNESRYASSLEMLRHMIAAGEGISLIPLLAAAEYATMQGMIAYREVDDARVGRTIALVWRATETRACKRSCRRGCDGSTIASPSPQNARSSAGFESGTSFVRRSKEGRVQLTDRVSIYQPEQKGLLFPERPHFDDPADERAYRKKHLVAACRAFALHGFDFGFAGHLTVRDPERPELYWTNPMAVHFSQVKLSNLILADHHGRVVEGSHAINRAGFVLHAAVHEMHPDVMAMCHAHTTYGIAYASLGRPLAPITQDAACFYGDHVVIKDSAGAVAVEEDAGTHVARAFGGNRAAIHQNHGLLTASRHSIDDAAWWFIALERCCQQALAVQATGITPVLIPEASARYSRTHVGNEFIGWLHFQTIYGHLEATQPDMFD